MTTTLPRSIIASKRSGFSLIDPQTELFHHKVGRAQHVAISYVWSDWTDDPDAGHHLRHWPELRQRLLTVVGPGASTFMKICSGHATRCWLDCKCIDQDSAADKSYWVPRMNEIYSEARCTVLLLRGVDIAPLQKAESLLGCDIDDDNHSCILTQSCASVTMTEELEESCLSSLRSIFAGAWRKRAWIFQEILLSKEYILNDGGGGEIKLSDLGTIASLLFRAHSDKEWLGELASWCRRIFRLRAYYFNYTLCPSNVLQLATSLDATLPCDKYYALCGVLRLKSVQYQITHTEHEALQNILVALTVEGRFSWLCAIPPSLPGHANRLVLDGPLLPYIENQLDLHATFYGQPEVSKSTVSFSCYHVGHVKETAPLAERIEEAAKFATDMSSPSATDIPRHIAIVPALLLRICRDAILPLVTEPILSRLCKVFHIPVKDAGSTVLMKLLTLRDPSSLYTAQQQQEQLPRGGNPLSGLDIDMAIAAARAIQHHLDDVKKDLDFVTWTAFPPDKDKTGNGTTEYYAIGTKGGTTTGTDTHVFSIRRRASHEFRLATLCLADGLAPTCEQRDAVHHGGRHRDPPQAVRREAPAPEEVPLDIAVGASTMHRHRRQRRRRWWWCRVVSANYTRGDMGEARARAPAAAITPFPFACASASASALVFFSNYGNLSVPTIPVCLQVLNFHPTIREIPEHGFRSTDGDSLLNLTRGGLCRI